MTNKGIIFFGVIIGVAFIALGFLVANTFYKVKALDNVISVAGSSQQVIKSDVVKWKTNFSRTTGINDLKNGYTLMKGDLEKVLAYLRQNGITDDQITVGVLSTNPNYASGSGGYYDKYGAGSQIIGYTLNQNVDIQSQDVEKFTKIAQDSGVLINQGVIFTSYGLEYYYSKLADLKLDMLAKATEDAKLRAQKIAQSTGSQVSYLKSASMGVFQITPVNSTELSDYGYYDTSSIDKQITSIVRASFTLK